MTPTGQTVCLCMIVKDEAHVIARCLASVRPIIDHWIVVDTGSTDGTQDIVRAAMAGLPGEVVERPWVDFAHNRSEALALARSRADYSFVIDADDELVLPPGFEMSPLDADSYVVDIHYGATTYQRPQLVRNALEWRYRGVVHEFLECAAATTTGHVPIVMKINHEGSRSTDPATYAKDAAILERALAGESDPFLVSRYTFYLAQSFRDCGEREKALEAYLRRAELGYWAEEVFVSLLNAGRLMEGLGRDADATLAVYARATQAAPFRAEAAHSASSLCRRLSRFAEGYAIAEPARTLPAPPSGLFVEPWSYEYGLCDELAVNAYWAGHYRECLDAALQALQSGKVPEADRPRYLANMRFALDRLPVAEAPTATNQSPISAAVAVQNTVPKILHLGSGKDFRDDWLNIDIDETWYPDALLDLSRMRLGDEGIAIETRRFGPVVLRTGMFEAIVANDVLEHVPDLVALMTTCLALLETGGRFEINVPFDLAYGAWQDPTHVRAFNERSWLYYTDWFWYLGWRKARFDVVRLEHCLSPAGAALRDAGKPLDEILLVPRAIDSMSVTLRKIALTDDDRRALDHWRDRRRSVEFASGGGGTSEAPTTALAGTWADNKDRYCIWTVTPPGSVHHQAFDDAAAALSAAFAELGGSAPIVASREAHDGRTPIVFGAHLLAPAEVADLERRAIVFNLEQVDSASLWNNVAYRKLLSTHPVLDYSVRNIGALAAAGVTHARHMAISGMPPAVPAASSRPRDVDILFYGSTNARRAAILDELRAQGLAVVQLFGVYGAERDRAIDGAKVVVNIHYYEAAVFERVRVAHLLARGACVVSEGEPDDPDVADIAGALVLCPYNEIVQRCVALAGDALARDDLSARAATAIAARTQSEILRRIFA